MIENKRSLGAIYDLAKKVSPIDIVSTKKRREDIPQDAHDALYKQAHKANGLAIRLVAKDYREEQLVLQVGYLKEYIKHLETGGNNLGKNDRRMGWYWAVREYV